MAVNSSEWANAVLPSQVCQDLCSLPSSNSCSIEETRLFHTAFQNPQDSSQAEKHYYSPCLVLSWFVEAESGIIPTGDEPKNTEIKRRNIFFYQIAPFTSWVQDAPKKKNLLLSGTYGSWMPWMCSKHSSLLRVPECHQQLGQVLPSGLCPPVPHLSPQQSLGNEWHS